MANASPRSSFRLTFVREDERDVSPTRELLARRRTRPRFLVFPFAGGTPAPKHAIASTASVSQCGFPQDLQRPIDVALVDIQVRDRPDRRRRRGQHEQAALFQFCGKFGRRA